jgi:hypothetical protein
MRSGKGSFSVGAIVNVRRTYPGGEMRVDFITYDRKIFDLRPERIVKAWQIKVVARQ